MPEGLHRFYGDKNKLHFITCSCYRRQTFLDQAGRRDLVLSTLEDLRLQLGFRVEGYVVMPTHIHLLVSEPAEETPSLAMQLLKQRTSLVFNRVRKSPIAEAFWQTRFHDFSVFTHEKRAEKINYMHHNPVKKGLVETSVDWMWSSARYYNLQEEGPVTIEYRE